MWCPEEEKNEKEKREEKSMPALFMEINRQYGMRCMQRIREIGIQRGQMPIIMIVYRNNGCSQKEIAECMGVTPPTVNVSIQRLEKNEIKKLQKNISSELLASFGRQLTKTEDIPARLN